MIKCSILELEQNTRHKIQQHQQNKEENINTIVKLQILKIHEDIKRINEERI